MGEILYTKEFVDFIKQYKRELDIRLCATYLLEQNWSIRVISDNTGIPKSSVYDYLSKYLKYIDDDLYIRCKNKLKNHKKEIKHHRDRAGKFKSFN